MGADVRYSKDILDVRIVVNSEQENLGHQFYRQFVDRRDEVSECGHSDAFVVAQFDEGVDL
jgi:hypothetical protein